MTQEEFTSAMASENMCHAETTIKARPDRVYAALFKLSRWPEFLPHVKAVDVMYDDGKYQEFVMHVASETGDLKVRSIRRCCEQTGIRFFQPEPPPYLISHFGGWTFESDSQGGCKLKTYHRWVTKTQAALNTFKDTEVPVAMQIKRVLLDHAKLALSRWKEVLEHQQSAELEAGAA